MQADAASPWDDWALNHVVPREGSLIKDVTPRMLKLLPAVIRGLTFAGTCHLKR